MNNDGDSSSGRTAGSGSASIGSTPISQFFCMARSSSGQGHCPLKAEITGSNPVRATTLVVENYFQVVQLSVCVLYFYNLGHLFQLIDLLMGLLYVMR